MWASHSGLPDGATVHMRVVAAATREALVALPIGPVGKNFGSASSFTPHVGKLFRPAASQEVPLVFPCPTTSRVGDRLQRSATPDASLPGFGVDACTHEYALSAGCAPGGQLLSAGGGRAWCENVSVMAARMDGGPPCIIGTSSALWTLNTSRGSPASPRPHRDGRACSDSQLPMVYPHSRPAGGPSLSYDTTGHGTIQRFPW
jgi:hypothetical protein